MGRKDKGVKGRMSVVAPDKIHHAIFFLRLSGAFGNGRENEEFVDHVSQQVEVEEKVQRA